MSRITPSTRCTRYTEGLASGGRCGSAAGLQFRQNFSRMYLFWRTALLPGWTLDCCKYWWKDVILWYVCNKRPSEVFLSVVGERRRFVYCSFYVHITSVIPAELLMLFLLSLSLIGWFCIQQGRKLLISSHVWHVTCSVVYSVIIPSVSYNSNHCRYKMAEIMKNGAKK